MRRSNLSIVTTSATTIRLPFKELHTLLMMILISYYKTPFRHIMIFVSFQEDSDNNQRIHCSMPLLTHLLRCLCPSSLLC